MKKKQSVWNERGTKPILIGLAIVIALCAIGYKSVYAGDAGWWYSYSTIYTPGSYWHSADCDSGHILFAYPDSTDYYDTVDLVVSGWDNQILLWDSLYLDSIGEHFMTIVYYLEDDSTSDSVKGSWDHFNAWIHPGAVGSVPTYTKTCAVSVVVLDNRGDPVENVAVTAMLARSNLVDSAGYAVVNVAQRITTNSEGIATFNCRWSSYLIPATEWRFVVAGVRGPKCTYTVPRETSTTLNLNTDCD